MVMSFVPAARVVYEVKGEERRQEERGRKGRGES